MTDVEQKVDDLIAAFDLWFQNRGGNQPLVKAERAIVKTFLYYVTKTPTDERPLLPVLEQKVQDDAQHGDSGGVLPVLPRRDTFRTPGIPSYGGVPGFGDGEGK